MDVLSHNQSQKRTGEPCAPGNAGMEVAILPILEKEGEYGIENQDLGTKDGVGYGDGYYGYVPKPLMKYPESGEAQTIREDEMGPVAPGGRIKDLDQHWKWLLMARRVSGLDELREFARGNKLPFKKNSFYDEAAALVGKCVQPYHTTDSQVSDGMEV